MEQGTKLGKPAFFADFRLDGLLACLRSAPLALAFTFADLSEDALRAPRPPVLLARPLPALVEARYFFALGASVVLSLLADEERAEWLRRPNFFLPVLLDEVMVCRRRLVMSGLLVSVVEPELL